MKLDTSDLRRKLKIYDHGGTSAQLAEASGQAMKSSERSLSDQVMSTFEDRATQMPGEAGRSAVSISYIDNDRDYRTAKNKARTYLDPITYAAAAVVMSTFAEHNVRSFDRQMERMRTTEHTIAPSVRIPSGDNLPAPVTTGSEVGAVDTDAFKDISAGNGIQAASVHRESMLEYQLRGVTDAQADAAVIRGSNGRYSHINESGQAVFGADDADHMAGYRGSSQESWAGVRHDMDTRLSSLSDGNYYARLVSAHDLETPDGVKVPDLFTDGSGNRMIDNIRPEDMPAKFSVTEISNGTIQDSVRSAGEKTGMGHIAEHGFHDMFYMEKAGSARAVLRTQDTFSFMNDDGTFSGKINSHGDTFHGIIKDGRIDYGQMQKKGYSLSFAQDTQTGKVFGVTFIKDHQNFMRTGSRSTMSSLNNRLNTMDAYRDTLGLKRTLRDRISVRRTLDYRKKLKGLDPEQAAMIHADMTGRRARRGFKGRKLSIRRLKTSFIRLAQSEMYNDEAFSTGYRETQNYTNQLRAVGRLVRRPLGALGNGLHRGVGTRIDAAIVSRMQKILNSKKVNGKLQKSILKNISRVFARLAKEESLRGAMISAMYHSITGVGGLMVQAPASLLAATTKNIPGVGNVTGKIARGVRAGRERAASLNGFSELNDVVKAAVKQPFRMGAQAAGKGAKALDKGTSAVMKKVLGERRYNRVAALGHRLSAPFKALGKTFKKAGAAVSKILGWIKATLIEPVVTFFSTITSALLGVLAGAAIVFVVIVFAYFVAGVGYSFINTFISLASDDTISATAATGQPTVSVLTNLLTQMHNDEVDKIHDELKKPKTLSAVVYDNGSEENFKECISAMTVMEGQSYGNYGTDRVNKALEKAYDASHKIYIVMVDVPETRHRTVKKKVDGKEVEQEETYTVYVKYRQVHLLIFRNEAVVNQEEAAVEAAVNSAQAEASGEINAQTNTEWTRIVAATKKAYAQTVGYYKWGGSDVIKYNDEYSTESHAIRTDCSGFVSECLRRAGINFSGNSGAFNAESKYWTRHAWDGKSVNGLVEGDILVYSHHVEIYAGDGTTDIVYNNGSNSSAADSGATQRYHGHVGKCYLRLKFKKAREETTKTTAEEEKKKGEDKIKKGSTGVTAGSKFVWDYLRSKGFSDKVAACIMGCWKCESGITTFSIEGTYSDDEQKAKVKELDTPQKMNDYTLNYLFPKYKNSGQTWLMNIGSNKGGRWNAYKWPKSNVYGPGIGLAGYTGGRAEKLFNAGKKNGTEWYDAGFQLNWAVQEIKNTKQYAKAMEDAEAAADITTACIKIMNGYEGNHATSLYPARIDAAKNIYGKYKGSSITSDFSKMPTDLYSDFGSSGGSGSYEVDYHEISYDSKGDETGGRNALKKELEEVYSKYKAGKYKQTVMYDSRKKDTDKWKADRQHVLTSRGGKGTGLDFLRCLIYSKHGVTLPKDYTTVWNEPGRNFKTRGKPGSYYDYYDNIDVGDIIVYQIYKEQPLTRKNCILFSYAGQGDIYAFLNESFADNKGRSYKKGSVIKMKYSDLRYDNIINVIDVRGITVDERHLAYPEVGFGGFRTDEDMKAIYPEKKDKKTGEEYSDGYTISEVQTFNNYVNKKNVWYDMYSDEEPPDYKTEDGTKLYYDGYYELDFSDDKSIDPNSKSPAELIKELDGAIKYIGGTAKVLPSTFVTEALIKSNMGSSSLWELNRNPVALRRWWPDRKAHTEPYLSWGRNMDSDGYLKFTSMKECARAWYRRNLDLNGSNPDTGYESKEVRKWHTMSTADYAAEQKKKGGDPAYVYVLKYYLDHIYKESSSDMGADSGSSADDIYISWLSVIQENDVPKCDEKYNGTKYKGKEEQITSDQLEDVADYIYYDSGTETIKLDQNGDHDITIDDLPPKYARLYQDGDGNKGKGFEGSRLTERMYADLISCVNDDGTIDMDRFEGCNFILSKSVKKK